MGDVLAESAANAHPRNVTLSIRPEQLELVTDSLGPNAQVTKGRNRLAGRAVAMTFLGDGSEHVVEVNGQTLKVVSTPPKFSVPDEVVIECDPADVVIVARDDDGGEPNSP